MSPEINSDVSRRVIAGLVVTAIVTIIGWIIDQVVASPGFRPVLVAGAIFLIAIGWVVVLKFLPYLRQLSGEILSAIRWLVGQWRYILLAVLLIVLELVLYGLGGQRLVICSFAHLILVVPLVLLLFGPKRAAVALPGAVLRFGEQIAIRPFDVSSLIKSYRAKSHKVVPVRLLHIVI
jgi:hypothetical protein